MTPKIFEGPKLCSSLRKHSQSSEFDINFVKTVLNSFYVDDFTGGKNHFERALDLCKKLKIRFLEGLFHLRKWQTNHPKQRKLIFYYHYRNIRK